MELSIDTSSNTAGIAISDSGIVLSEYNWCSEMNHNRELIPNIINIMGKKRTLQDIQGIIVAIGPGSFNGLRVGIATAKGLAISLKAPVVGISTLEVEAYPYALIGKPVCAISDAGRGEIAAAIFQQKNGQWLKLIEEHITSVSDLVYRITEDTIFCGQLKESVVEIIKNELGTKATIIKGAAFLRRAGCLAELGWKRLVKSDYDNPATLQPIYLRKPSITQSKKTG